MIRHTIFIINFGSRTAAPPNHVARVRFSLFGMCTSVCVCVCLCVRALAVGRASQRWFSNKWIRGMNMTNTFA